MTNPVCAAEHDDNESRQCIGGFSFLVDLLFLYAVAAKLAVL